MSKKRFLNLAEDTNEYLYDPNINWRKHLDYELPVFILDTKTDIVYTTDAHALEPTASEIMGLVEL